MSSFLPLNIRDSCSCPNQIRELRPTGLGKEEPCRSRTRTLSTFRTWHKGCLWPGVYSERLSLLQESFQCWPSSYYAQTHSLALPDKAPSDGLTSYNSNCMTESQPNLLLSIHLIPSCVYTLSLSLSSLPLVHLSHSLLSVCFVAHCSIFLSGLC